MNIINLKLGVLSSSNILFAFVSYAYEALAQCYSISHSEHNTYSRRAWWFSSFRKSNSETRCSVLLTKFFGLNGPSATTGKHANGLSYHRFLQCRFLVKSYINKGYFRISKPEYSYDASGLNLNQSYVLKISKLKSQLQGFLLDRQHTLFGLDFDLEYRLIRIASPENE